VLNDRKSLRVWDASECVLAFIDYQQHVFDVIFAQDRRAAGFIGYGGTSGARAVENLRLIMGELQLATVRSQVGISLCTDFENFQRIHTSFHARELCPHNARPTHRMGWSVESPPGETSAERSVAHA
jgi:hypothetical protein